MNKKQIYFILIFVFFVMWVLGIIIGYNKGKKNAEKKSNTVFLYSNVDKNLNKYNTEKNIMEPYPILYNVDEETFKPVIYNFKLNIEEKFSIIDEAGNSLQDKQLAFSKQEFAYNIIDTDIKQAETLKNIIKFNELEPVKLEGEFYKGLSETEDEEDKNSSDINIKEPHYEIYTNL